MAFIAKIFSCKGIGIDWHQVEWDSSSKPVHGSPEFARISLIASTPYPNSPDPTVLELWFTETDFGPTSAKIITDHSSMETGSWMTSVYVDDGNTPFNEGTPLASLASSNAGNAGPVSAILPTIPFTTYSVTTYLKLTIAAGNTASADLTLRSMVLPDGGSSVALLSMALMAIESVRRRFCSKA